MTSVGMGIMVQLFHVARRPEFMLRKYCDPCVLHVGLRAKVLVVRGITEFACSLCTCTYVPNSSL